MAISTSPQEFSNQKAWPSATFENVDSLDREQLAISSFVFTSIEPARTPVMQLP